VGREKRFPEDSGNEIFKVLLILFFGSGKILLGFHRK